jgi:putative hydrolase of the HAD superfamily
VSIRAVVFDIGGVLERVGDLAWLDRWRLAVGMDTDEFDAALDSVDPEGSAETGGLTEEQWRRRCADALGLSERQADEFMREMWDWYCAEPEQQLIDYLAGLRPRYRTGILANSADGARREEARRYGFPDLVDVLAYSHEVGVAKPDPRVYALTCEWLGVQPAETVFVDDLAANVDAATGCGLHGVLHTSPAETMTRVDALLRG